MRDSVILTWDGLCPSGDHAVDPPRRRHQRLAILLRCRHEFRINFSLSSNAKKQLSCVWVQQMKQAACRGSPAAHENSSRGSPRSNLENQFACKSCLPFRNRCALKLPCYSAVAGILRPPCSVEDFRIAVPGARNSKVWMIQNVKHLDSELYVEILGGSLDVAVLED
jgi:hypothetical protein